MGEIIKENYNATSRIYSGPSILEQILIKECFFADDLVVAVKSDKELRKNMEIWNIALAAWNLKNERGEIKDYGNRKGE